MNPMYQLPIIERNIVAKNTIETVFDISGHKCDFRPGQYINIVLPKLISPDPKGNHRDFSIVSSPNDKKRLAIAFRVSQSGFKQTFVNLPIGTKVSADCCYGAFMLPDEPLHPIVFIAGGIGITPCLSSIRFATEEKLSHKILLIYGNKDVASAAYLEELETLEKKNPNFRMQKLFGPITEDSIKENALTLEHAIWFVVGPSAMVGEAKKVLFRLGVSDESVRSEEFTSYGEIIGDKADTQSTSAAIDNPSISVKEALLNALNRLAIVSETDLQGSITSANDKFCEISKYSRNELIGQNHRIVKSGFHPPSFYDELWKTITSGGVWRGEIKNKAKDGSYYWVDSSITPIFGEDGRIIKYIAVRFPITDKKNIEEKNSLLAGVVEQTTQAWGMADMSGKMVSANTAFLRMLGYTLFEVKTLMYEDIIVPEERERISGGVASVARDKNSFFTETECIRKDGLRIPILLLVNFYLENGIPKYAYAFLSDITEQRKREKEISELLADSEKMNKLMVRREIRMAKLKKEIEELRRKTGNQ